MAFPSVAASNVDAVESATSLSVNMPTGIAAGNLLMVFVATDDAPTVTQSGGSDWTRIVHTPNGSDTRLTVFAKIAAGSDTLTVASSDSVDIATIAIRVIDHGVSNVSTDITMGTAATGSSAAPNPPNCNPAVAKDYLWLESFASDDDDNATTYWSANFTGIAQQKSATGLGTCMVAAAYRQLNASSLDPGNMALSATEQWVAQTFAIPPGTTPLTLAATDPNDTAAFAMTEVGTFALAATDPNDTAAFTMLQATMTLAATDPNDTAAFAAGIVTVGMTLGATDPNDTAVFAMAEDGTDLDLAATDPIDIGAFVMSAVTVGMTLGATDPNDTAAFAANIVTVGMTLGATDPNDTAAFQARETPTSAFEMAATDPVDLADFAMEIATVGMALIGTDPRDIADFDLEGEVAPAPPTPAGTASQRRHSYSGLFADFSPPKKGEPPPLPEAEPEPNPDAEPQPIREPEPQPVPEWVIPQEQVGESAIVRYQTEQRRARQIEVDTALAALGEFAKKRRASIAEHNRRALLLLRRW